jgi:tRNA-modifying protein YgfZ
MFERLAHRCVISCFGPDASSFLQGLITNDIRLGNCYTAMLSPKGKYLFDFFIYKSSEQHYMLECGNSALLEQLNFYLLSSEVALEDVSSQFSVIYSREPFSSCDSMCQKDSRFNQMGFRTLTQDNFSEGSISGLYLEDKYKYAIPDGDLDMVMHKSFPIEFGLNYLNGVSYAKGCYMGQELIARFKGKPLARKVYKVSAAFNLENTPKGTSLFHESKEVGCLCSARGNSAIALVRVGTFDKTCLLEGLEVLLSPAPWYENRL